MFQLDFLFLLETGLKLTFNHNVLVMEILNNGSGNGSHSPVLSFVRGNENCRHGHQLYTKPLQLFGTFF